MVLALLPSQVLCAGAISLFRDESFGHIMVKHDIQFQDTHQIVTVPMETRGCTVFAVYQDNNILHFDAVFLQ